MPEDAPVIQNTESFNFVISNGSGTQR
jgi:hypothetical protein